MPETNKFASNRAFDMEIARYARLKTQGHRQDILNLEHHIANLTAAAPKDAAGEVTGEKRSYIMALNTALIFIKDNYNSTNPDKEPLT